MSSPKGMGGYEHSFFSLEKQKGANFCIENISVTEP